MPLARQSFRITVFDVNDTLAFLAATVANLTLIYLVFKVKNKEMRTYKWIVSIQALLEFISATILYTVKLVS